MALSDLYPPSRYVKCAKCGALYAGVHQACGLSLGVSRSAKKLAKIAREKEAQTAATVLPMRAKAGGR